MDKIVVIGGGGHAKVVISILKKLQRFEVCGYVDRQDNGPLLGCRYLGGDNVLDDLFKVHSIGNAVIGLGMMGDDGARKNLCLKARAIGYRFPAVISPDARINEDTTIADGTVVMDGAVVNCGCTIGEFCIVNTNVTVDHDCRIADNVHVAPGAVLCGSVKVGSSSFIGAGVTVIQNKKVGECVLIGAGAVIVDDCESPGTYIGRPAKLLVK